MGKLSSAPQKALFEQTVSVLIAQPLPGPYDYVVPPDCAVQIGCFVEVPLGRRTVRGVVWGEGQGDVDPEKLRPLEAVIDCPPLPEPVRRLVDWTAAYTMSQPGSVLRMAMSVSDALDPPPPQTLFRMGDPLDEGVRLSAARKRVLSVLEDGRSLTASDLAAEAGCGTGVIKAMAQAGMIQRFEIPHRPEPAPVSIDRGGPELTDAQAQAADQVCQAVGQGAFAPFLLDGVAGSGKTEVYFEAIGAALAAGKQVLILLPEIALSSQWLSRFSERFGISPVEWHSAITPARRRKAWRAIIEGSASLVVGARSALFLPYIDLGLIIVDEEHEAAFKQEDGVIYNARDMAVVRARIEGVPIVLASATPSLESRVNANNGRYGHLILPSRVGRAVMPDIDAIDLRENPPERQQFLSPPLREGVATALERGEQTLLFLNRRGYAPLTLCRACGHRFACGACTAWLVEHRLARRLRCHHCGYSVRLPPSCPACGTEDSLTACGPGVERIAEEVADLFPDAAVELMTSDSVHNPLKARALIERITER
ncbi:MAG: primosomal protein N', partial [Pseudomonadota bacterium]